MFETIKVCDTYWVKLYLSGPIEVAKQVLRGECFAEGLCVTIDPTTYIYTGGEENGYVVGLIDYPRFPKPKSEIAKRAMQLAEKLVNKTFQQSVLVQDPEKTVWLSIRPENKVNL